MTRPVYAIPPSFDSESRLDTETTAKYLKYLESKGATRVLTTAGTSQFNLLDVDEIFELNRCLIDNFSREKILGLPALSNYHLKTEIKRLNELSSPNTKLLLLFPERYYSDYQILQWVEFCCNYSNYPVYLHGNTLRKGNGGIYQYSNELLTKLSNINGFVGIKEEYSSLDISIKEIPNLDLDIIVAGGSMRRFWTLQPFGATSFLTGVGNFNPLHSELFYDSFIVGDYKLCKKIIQEVEKPLFDSFMKIGWHASMRDALREMNYISHNRSPFIKLSDVEKKKVVKALNKIL